jgi:hypothetical protein
MTKTLAGSWSIARIPLGWQINQGGKAIAHTATSLGIDEGLSVANRIVEASDMGATLDAAMQEGKVHIF